jgi:hypothetical protein
MSRLPLALALALIANPLLVGCAHDPLDDKSGEEEFAATKAEAVDAEGKPRSAKAERQEVDLKKEEDEIEQTQFKFNEEKESFIADKSEVKEVLSAQHQRDLVLGRKSNTGPPTPSSGPTPKASKDKGDDGSDGKGSDSGSTTTATHKPKAAKGGDDAAKKKDDSAAK